MRMKSISLMDKQELTKEGGEIFKRIQLKLNEKERTLLNRLIEVTIRIGRKEVGK